MEFDPIDTPCDITRPYPENKLINTKKNKTISTNLYYNELLC